MVASRAWAKTFCRAVARGPGESATGGAEAGEGEREGALLPFGPPLTAAGIVGWVSGVQWGILALASSGRAWALVYGWKPIFGSRSAARALLASRARARA